MSQPPTPSIVGSVVERASSSRSSFQAASSSSPSGFPSVQHRSKSAFARAREAKHNGTQDTEKRRSREVPVVRKSGELLSNNQGRQAKEELVQTSDDFFGPFNASSSSTNPQSEDKWKTQMMHDNERAIESMSEEERERHVREIMEQLGPNVGVLLRKAREARTGSQAGFEAPKQEPEITNPAPNLSDEAHTTHDPDNKPNTDTEVNKPSIETESVQPVPTVPQSPNKLASPTRGILVSTSTPVSRSSSPGRGPRKLRFADVTSKDVHVFQSEPSSPRRTLGLLPPPDSDSGGSPVQSLRPRPREGSLEEGTPEDIRRRFFPHLPANEPSLEWIESDDKAASIDSEPRFDLSGALIPVAERDSLPTHLGLHHHGGPSTAGYTLTDLFLLARSSVPAQRATVLSVLTKIVRKLARLEDTVSEIKDRDSVRSRALVVGLSALTEKGSLGVQAIELTWTCVVFWDENEVEGLEGVELKPLSAKPNKADEENNSEDLIPSFDPISSLPLPALLPQIAALLDGHDLPHESLSQLLRIVHRFARHSVEIATTVSETPQLTANIVRTFLLTPIPPPKNGPTPNPDALDLLYALALSSRANARALEGPADALLRFITSAVPFSASPFPHALTEVLLCKTLDLYSILSKYGLYSGVATTAAEHFGRLSNSILVPSGDVSDRLKVSWLRLLSVWMLCARDPHRTTPTHDLLWSQVVGWSWGEDLLSFRNKLLAESSVADNRIWSALWDALGSWLEGCRVNSAKSGQDERDSINASVEKTWPGGVEKKIVEEAVTQLNQELLKAFANGVENAQRHNHYTRIAELSQTLSDFANLCLGCLQKRAQTSTEEGNPPAAWLHEAISLISPAALAILSCNGWSPSGQITDELSDELIIRTQILRLRSSSSFLASFLKLSRVISANDSWLAQGVATLGALLPGDEEGAQWIIEELTNNECTEIECAEKIKYLMPFFKNMTRPDETIYFSPLSPTPDSIQLCTTQCLPANCLPSTSSRRARFGLPLARDWPSITLDHLLRSGTSPILTNPESVPSDWNASEIDLVQASLSLMHHLRSRMIASDLSEFALSSEHSVFACMKVFMLEHNQHENDSNEEVFRDTVVGKLMDALLKPFTLGSSPSELKATQSIVGLEVVAKGFLGAGTPFYQFYTDFVALYDAISFSHGTFARLLLPPTSVSYAPDYRKLLWGDYGHTLRTIQTSIDDALTSSLKPYLWPPEKDAEMLGWYLRALIMWPLVGFIRFIAVHHIACSIWPDLQKGEEGQPIRDKRSRMLLVALSSQASHDVVKDVVRYVQDQTALQDAVPPACYIFTEKLKTERLTFVKDMGEPRILDNMEKIFAAEI